MLEILLASLPSLLPQEPPSVPAPTRVTAIQPERWLPDNTLAAIVVQPFPPGTAAAKLLNSDAGRGLLSTVSELLRPAMSSANVSADDAASILRGGMALGLVDLDRGVQPDVVLIAGVGDAELALAAHMSRLPTEGGLRVLGSSAPRLYVGLRNGRLCAGTNARTVTETLERSLDGRGVSLGETEDYARSLPQDSGQLLGNVFVRMGTLSATLFDSMPAEQADMARRFGDVFGVRDMEWLGGSWHLTDGELVSHWQLRAPQSQALLLDALAGTKGRIDTGLARFVPSGATGCGFFAVRFGTVFDELLALVGMAAPGGNDMVDRSLEGLRQRTGIDVRADLIAGLEERMLTFTLPGEGTQFGAMIELRQGTTFVRALGKLLPLLPLGFEEGTSSGAPCWRVPGDGDQPAVAVAGNWLVLASSDTVLAQTTRQIRDPRADPDVLAFLRSLPEDTTAASFGPLMPIPGPWTQLAGAATGGDRRMIVRRDADGFVAEERAPAEPVLQLAAAMVSTIGNPMGLAAAPSGESVGDPTAAATLRALEQEGRSRMNVTSVAAMLSHGDPAVVARACWLLGEWQARDAVPMLTDVVRDHRSAEARLQATSAIARMAGAMGAEALAFAVGDDDPRVRHCAVQAIARLGSGPATGPILSMLDRRGSTRPQREPDDLVAALVALHDIGEPTNLLAAASAIGFADAKTGQALAFLFQGLSPRMTANDEASTLLAVLDHPEPLLRRYAIQRLGELRDPDTAGALEGRLAVEGNDLQPLIRVSLTQVRGDGDRGDDDLVARAKSNVTAISQMVERRWNRLGTTAKVVTAASIGGLLLLVVGVILMRRHARRRSAAAEAMAMVGPSAGYAASGRDDQHDDFYEDDEQSDEYAEVGTEGEERF